MTFLAWSQARWRGTHRISVPTTVVSFLFVPFLKIVVLNDCGKNFSKEESWGWG